MPRTRLDRERTTVDVMDHVLDKGIVIETEHEGAGTRGAASTGRIVLFGVDTRVEIVTDLDDTLRSTQP
jgi:phosphatidate phosphatase APP1